MYVDDWLTSNWLSTTISEVHRDFSPLENYILFSTGFCCFCTGSAGPINLIYLTERSLEKAEMNSAESRPPIHRQVATAFVQIYWSTGYHFNGISMNLAV